MQLCFHVVAVWYSFISLQIYEEKIIILEVMIKKRENTVDSKQRRLDGFFKKTPKFSEDDVKSYGSAVAGKMPSAQTENIDDIEDMLTMKKRKHRQCAPEPGKMKRKLKLVNLSSYFSNSCTDADKGSRKVLKEFNGMPSIKKGNNVAFNEIPLHSTIKESCKTSKVEQKVSGNIVLGNFHLKSKQLDSEVFNVCVKDPVVVEELSVSNNLLPQFNWEVENCEGDISVSKADTCQKEVERLVDVSELVSMRSNVFPVESYEKNELDTLSEGNEILKLVAEKDFKELEVEPHGGCVRSVIKPTECIVTEDDANLQLAQMSSVNSMMQEVAVDVVEFHKPDVCEGKIDMLVPQDIMIDALGSVSELEDKLIMNDSTDLFEDEMSEFLEDWQLNDIATLQEPQLRLDSWQRCKVKSVDHEGRCKKIHVCAPESGAVADCLLKGVWVESSVQVGDIVSIVARKASDNDFWVVDNEEGFMIHYPDTLVSGTAVVGSLFCQRRGVLSDWFRGLDANSKIMVIGSLIHELLQEVLKQKIYVVSAIHSLIKRLVHSSESIRMMYSCNMTMAEARNELLEMVPRIKEFIEMYVTGSRRHGKSGNWSGKIYSVSAIEENYWISQLGLKGKVDVSVEVQEAGQEKCKMMPLEVKTGRASNSIEHRGQVILYTLMAAETCPDVDAGLLLYLRENTVTKVQVGRNERRDIICRRNELASFLNLSSSKSTDGSVFEPPHLPEPICNTRACQKCPYLDICSAFLQREGIEQLSLSDGMKQLVMESTAHITAEHIDYLVQWTSLLHLEEAERCSTSTLKDLWCMPPAQRENRGKCLAGLMLEDCVVNVGPGCNIHSFQRAGELCDMRRAGFEGGDLVLISTDKRLALSTGIVLDVSEDSLTVDFPRDVSKSNPNGIFHIDQYELQGQMSSSLTNLGALFENSKRKTELRHLIIDRRLPMFGRTHPEIFNQGLSFLQTLNLSQKQAVLQAMAAHDYLLIKGMPGTGKTALISALIQLLVHQGQSVLLTSHTHSAVDNVLLKLLEHKVEFLRLGKETRIHEKIRPWSETVLTENCSSPELLDAVYNSKPVVATTCLGSNHILFLRRSFNVCIVDESTQVLQPTVLSPVFRAEKFILVGDPNQLPPVVRSKKASQLGLSESLFVRLDRPETTVCLDQQYRMNNAITALANVLTYNGQLKCATTAVAEATISVGVAEEASNKSQWLSRALSNHMKDAILFLDTSDMQNNKMLNCTNETEAAIVKQLLEAFIQAGMGKDSIGVIAPYRGQVALLKKLMNGIEVNTVDQYQGRDKDIILFSCTKSRSSDHRSKEQQQPNETEILNDKRRLTVAITRAKHKLIIIGNIVTLKAYSPFYQLITGISESNIVSLKELS